MDTKQVEEISKLHVEIHRLQQVVKVQKNELQNMRQKYAELEIIVVNNLVDENKSLTEERESLMMQYNGLHSEYTKLRKWYDSNYRPM